MMNERADDDLKVGIYPVDTAIEPAPNAAARYPGGYK